MAFPEFRDPETSFRRSLQIPPRTAVVLSVPHAGTSVDGFNGSLAASLDVRSDADLLVDGLYGVGEPDAAASNERPGDLLGDVDVPDVSYVVALLSRFVCDMNRDSDDVSRAAVPDHPAPRNADGRGFVWAITTTGTPAL
ncbi:MAG: N-formylglutamate amidohydrolase, partial [Deltaproteobacteria bacterium]|nr:N-formylglutamate amidohydrolase [Deltaproteobacteria bacterium]